MNKLEWQIFCFLKGQTLGFSVIVIVTVFWDFAQHFLRNAMSESADISRVGIPSTYTYISTLTDKTMKVLLNLKSNLTSLRFLMNFTLKYSKNNDFLGYFCFWVAETLFSVISHVFHFVLKFCDFSVFSESWKTCHSSISIWISGITRGTALA